MNTLFSKYNVLIVDEDKYLAKLMGSVLSSFELGSIRVVHSKKEGMEILNSNNNTDVLITDWLVNTGHGLEMVNALRHSKILKQQTLPIILCTGMTSLNNIYQARDVGVNEILLKPVSPKEIVKKIAAALFKSRDFVKSEEGFMGPDRRRMSRDFDGEDKRTTTSEEGPESAVSEVREGQKDG